MNDSLSDSLRIYLRELRIKRGISQEKVADAIGWSSRSFSDWETGKSGDIKARYLIRLVSLLQASWDDVAFLELKDATTESAMSLVEKRINAATQPPSYTNELHSLAEQLWSDESLRKVFLIFWSGWNAKDIEERAKR